MRVLSAYGELRGFKLWRPHADLGIAGETKAFARQEQPHIHFAIGIFVVNQRHGISAGLHAGDLDISGPGGCDLYLARLRILATVREIVRIGAEADEHIALFGPEARYRQIDGRRDRRSDGHRCFTRGRACADQQGRRRQPGRKARCPCRTACPKSENIAHNYLCTLRDAFRDGWRL